MTQTKIKLGGLLAAVALLASGGTALAMHHGSGSPAACEAAMRDRMTNGNPNDETLPGSCKDIGAPAMATIYGKLVSEVMQGSMNKIADQYDSLANQMVQNGR